MSTPSTEPRLLERLGEFYRAVDRFLVAYDTAPGFDLARQVERLRVAFAAVPRPGVASVGGMEWPARCEDCGLVTEDPDAYHGDDLDLMSAERLCVVTGGFHRWAESAIHDRLSR